MGNDCLKIARNYFLDMQRHRRYLHENAELGFALIKTKEYVLDCLKNLGYNPKPCGRCGITAELGGKKNGYFLLRADMDGLPIREKTGEKFACKHGNMHACGHDLHAAMLLGAAAILKEKETMLNKGVRLLFQPAEETLEGAKDCIENGAIKDVFGAMMLHVLPSMPFPCGTAVISAEGFSAPAADFFDIEITGKGCHGSSPWQGVDALLIAAKTVVGVQTLAAREISSQIPATLTFGKLNAGEADNVIARKALLSGTLRTMNEETRGFVKMRMEEIAKQTAKAFRGRAAVRYKSGCPCLKNDGQLSALLYETALETLGKKYSLHASSLPSGVVGGSEDFAYISQKVPSIMAGICAGERGQVRDEPLHSPRVDFDERAMPFSAALLAATALRATHAGNKKL